MLLEKKKEILTKILSENGVMSEILFASLLSFVDDRFTRSNEFHCPECDAKLEIHTEIKVRRIINAAGEKFGAKISANLSQNAVHPLADSPLVPALVDAFNKLPTSCRPNNPASYLGTLIERGVPVRLPPTTKRLLYEQFSTTKIQAFGNGSMAVIIADGEFRQFIPVSILKGMALTGITTNGTEITQTRTQYTSEVWIKTRFGYIAERGIFYDEMHKRSIGDFAAQMAE